LVPFYGSIIEEGWADTFAGTYRSGEQVLNDLFHIASTIPTLSGNPAIDVSILILALTVASRFIRRSTTYLYDTQKKRTKLLTLRKTLELKSSEVAALRAALMHIREDSDHLRHHKLEEDSERARISQLALHKEFDPKHTELEQQLHQAISKPPHRFDA
jgi:hypothetical protein